MHPHFKNEDVGSTAMSSTNKNAKSSTNRTSVFGPQILKNSQTQKNSTANLKGVTSPNGLPLQMESKFKNSLDDKHRKASQSHLRMSQSSRERLPGISTH